MLMKTPNQSLTEQLSQRLAQRIRDRLLPAGARLPSVRETAQTQGVNPSTVVAAYDLLLAQGLVEARRNRGFFVRERAPLRDGVREAAAATTEPVSSHNRMGRQSAVITTQTWPGWREYAASPALVFGPESMSTASVPCTCCNQRGSAGKTVRSRTRLA